MESFTYSELIDRGLPDSEVRGRLRTGELRRLRRGGYLAGETSSPEQEYRALIATTVPVLAPGTVLSHQSAGIAWGLPAPRRLLTKVHTTREGVAGGHISGHVHGHRRPLPWAQLAALDGWPVTSLVRTAVDLASAVRRDEALAVMDAALRLGADKDELDALIAEGRHRRGIAQARWALPRSDSRSESPGESMSRYWMIVGGVPVPELQFEVRDRTGRLLGRTDFAWPAVGVLGEFDGLVKYSEGFDASGRSVGEVVRDEKRRETSLLFDGWRVIRWGSRDLADGLAFARRLNSFLGRCANAA